MQDENSTIESMLIDLVDAKNIQQVGGKASPLQELLTAGFPVPNGFVITPDTFLDDFSKAIPEIMQKFRELDSEFVAVRSSGINEDTKNASWAGQFQTILNVTESTLIQNIQSCHNSIAKETAQIYAQQHAQNFLPIAVIVQAMAQSKISGVAFSVHPVTNDQDLIVIEAGYGLGEAIVSGEITPDTYTISKAGPHVLDRHISLQNKKLVLSSEGNNWMPVTEGANDQKLSDIHITALVQLILQAEDHFGFPVDIEWAIENEQIYILQCRPITTL